MLCDESAAMPRLRVTCRTMPCGRTMLCGLSSARALAAALRPWWTYVCADDCRCWCLAVGANREWSVARGSPSEDGRTRSPRPKVMKTHEPEHSTVERPNQYPDDKFSFL